MKAVWIAGGLSLAAFAALPALSQAPAAPISDRVMTRAEVQASIAEHFARVDTNRDGVITRAEADSARTAMHGKIREHLAQRPAGKDSHAGGHGAMFDRLDANRDGSISRQEFDAGHSRMAERRSARKERRAGGMSRGMGAMHGRMFEMADANKDGKVSLQEATAAAYRHFDMADTNRDGQITREERIQMHQKMHAERKPG